MAGSTVVARVGLDDNGFQQGVSRIQRSLRLVRSEFAVASSRISGFGNTTEALRLKTSTLNRQIQLHRDRVVALSRSYQDHVRRNGETARSTENLRIRLNHATAELNNMQRELQETTSELNRVSSRWNRVSQVMQNAGIKMKAVGDKMSSLGKSLSLAVTVPILGIGTAATKMAMDAVESENLFEVAMGKMAVEARNWSEDISKSLGLNAYNVRK
ncbi:MAG: phage tail tape measure protein, partial [Clostridiales bacterium]